MQPQQDKRRRRRAAVGLLRSLVFLAALIALAVALSLRRAGPRVAAITLATALDDRYRPVEVTDAYDPGDTFFVSVRLEDYRADDDIVARWYYQDSAITDTPLEAEGLSGDIDAGFVLRNEDPPWPVGQYRVEILHEDRVIGSAEFVVASDSP